MTGPLNRPPLPARTSYPGFGSEFGIDGGYFSGVSEIMPGTITADSLAPGAGSSILTNWVSPLAYGAKGDAKQIFSTATITSGSHSLTIVGASLSSADVGKAICVQSAGVSGAALTTTITAVTGLTTCTLAAAASTTVPNAVAATATTTTGSDVVWGTDDTAAFQAALNSGFPTVYIGGSNYLLTGLLNVPNDVVLVGNFQWQAANFDTPYASYEGLGQPPAFQTPKTSTLYTTSGSGSATGTSFITLNRNSGLVGCVLYQPGQANPYANIPIAYPYMIQIVGGNGGYIDCCELVNPYQGIRLGDDTGLPSNSANLARVTNVTGQPLFIGLFAQNCYDSMFLTNIDWSVKYCFNINHSNESNDPFPLFTWENQNGTAFIMGGVDDVHGINLTSFGHYYGIRFLNEPSHQVVTGGCYGEFSNCIMESFGYAMDCQSTQFPGANVTGGIFSATIRCAGGSLNVTGINMYATAISNNTGGILILNGVALNSGSTGADVQQSGGMTMINNCTFAGGPVAPIINITGGTGFCIVGNMSTAGALVINNSSGLTGVNAIVANNGQF